MKAAAFNLTAIKQVPPEIRFFLKRVLIIVVVWKLLYHLVLLPIRIPDKPLTELTAYSTRAVFDIIHPGYTIGFKEEERPGFRITTLIIQGRKIIGIADSCNGLELFVLYVGFLFCIPSSNKKRLLYLIGGVAAIFVTNILRCYGLAWLYMHKYPIADFAHHYIFKMAIYAMIFFIWVRFIKKMKHVE